MPSTIRAVFPLSLSRALWPPVPIAISRSPVFWTRSCLSLRSRWTSSRPVSPYAWSARYRNGLHQNATIYASATNRGTSIADSVNHSFTRDLLHFQQMLILLVDPPYVIPIFYVQLFEVYDA